MLAYILAIAVGSIGLILYLTAFLAKKIHRKDDFLWSGVCAFYALVLWVCAERINGAVLLGQTAAVIVIIAFATESLNLRKAIANPEKIAELQDFSVAEWLLSLAGGLVSLVRKPKTKPVTTPTPSKTPQPAATETKVEDSTTATEIASELLEVKEEQENKIEEDTIEEVKTEEKIISDIEAVTEKMTQISEELEDLAKDTPPTPPTATIPNTTESQPKVNFFQKILANFKPKTSQTSTKMTAAPILETDESFDSEDSDRTVSENVAEQLTQAIDSNQEDVAVVDRTDVNLPERVISDSENEIQTEIETDTPVDRNIKTDEQIEEVETISSVQETKIETIKEIDLENQPENTISVVELTSPEQNLTTETESSPPNTEQSIEDSQKQPKNHTESESDFLQQLDDIFEEEDREPSTKPEKPPEQ